MSAFYSPDLKRAHGKAILGTKPGDILGFYDSVGTAQPASTLSTRQALEALGLVKAGGSDTVNTDALSKVADDSITDGVDYALGSTAGTKLGTASTQKLAFFGATPIIQPANTVDVFTGLVNLGLRTTGGTAAMTLPGALSCAALTTTSIAATGTIAATGHITITDAKNVVLDTTTGTKIGTGTTQKLGLWNATPIVQPANTVDIFTGLVNVGLRTAGGTAAMTLPGALAAAGSILSSSASAGIGYATGAGGTATQITNRSTGVTVSPNPCVSGTVTTNTTSLAGLASADFVVTNSAVAIGDTVQVSIQSGSNGGGTIVSVSTVTNGTFTIRVTNCNAAAGTAETGAIIINFAVIKAVSA
jgi:hypothetical protein